MDNHEIKTALSQIFRFQLEQRQSLFELRKTTAAMLETLRSAPGFSQSLYEYHLGIASERADGPHADSMQKFESLIQLFEQRD
jgi:hypothetical protein